MNLAKKLKNWEKIGSGLLRHKVPGGWLVIARVGFSGGITFYPDPEHKWQGGED